MVSKKIKFDYNPISNNTSRGIKDTFVSTNYTEPDIDHPMNPGNEIIGATSLEELDLIDNTNNIYVDPFKPLFLAPSLKPKNIPPPTKKDYLDLTINEFTEKMAYSFIGILNDLLDNNYTSMSDLLLKNDRGIAVSILFIFISLFLIFFTI